MVHHCLQDQIQTRQCRKLSLHRLVSFLLFPGLSQPFLPTYHTASCCSVVLKILLASVPFHMVLSLPKILSFSFPEDSHSSPHSMPHLLPQPDCWHPSECPGLLFFSCKPMNHIILCLFAHQTLVRPWAQRSTDNVLVIHADGRGPVGTGWQTHDVLY